MRDGARRRVLFLYENAPAHTYNVSKATIRDQYMSVLLDLPYSPDLAFSDFSLRGNKNVGIEEVKIAAL